MLFVNGARGVPPHNLNEVVAAVLQLVDDPGSSNEAVLELLLGPDYPTGGMIVDDEELWQLYAEGVGAVALRARHQWLRTDDERSLVFSELPPGVATGAVESAVANMVAAGDLAGVIDIQDRSAEGKTSLVLSLCQDIDEERVLPKLWAHTPLQVVERFNNDEPLLSLLRHWVSFELERSKKDSPLLDSDLGTAPEQLRLSLGALADRFGRPRRSTLIRNAV